MRHGVQKQGSEGGLLALVDLIETIDAEPNTSEGSVLHSIQDENCSVLLSVVEVLAGGLYGLEMREHVNKFLEDVPCQITPPTAPIPS